MSVAIVLERKIFKVGETVKGDVVIDSPGAALAHNGVLLTFDGEMTVELSSRSAGLFSALITDIRPVEFVKGKKLLSQPGKVPDGKTRLAFEFELKPTSDAKLVETYHGHFVQIKYMLKVEVQRSFLARNLFSECEVVVELPNNPKPEHPTPFTLTPASFKQVASAPTELAHFRVTGRLSTDVVSVASPLTGFVSVVELQGAGIQSIDLQLLRVETITSPELDDETCEEVSEIQTTQIATGNVAIGAKIPIYVVLPRLYVAPTCTIEGVQLKFEVNLVLSLDNGSVYAESFPLRTYR